MGGTVALQSRTLKTLVDNIISEEQLSAGRLTSRRSASGRVFGKLPKSSEIHFEDGYSSFE